MKILHLSDLHYGASSYSKFSDGNILDELCNSFTKYKGKIDLVIFSGDLVNDGKVGEDFKKAKDEFLSRITDSLGINPYKIVLSCGNHDVNRDFASDSLDDFFNTKIAKNDDLNKFTSENSIDFQHSIDGLNNFNSFVNDYYSGFDSAEVNPLYVIFKYEIENEKIGILSFNSSWRALKNDVKGKLLFPTLLLEDALTKIKDCTCKIAVTHHPLFYFNEFNYWELQKKIHKEFDMIFSGHIHQAEVNTHYKQNNGIYATVSSASLTYDKSYIGYSIHDYDIPIKSKVIFTEEKLSGDHKFVTNEPVIVTIPCSEEKNNQNRIRDKIQSKINLELANGRDLLLNRDVDDDNENIFLDLFKNPVLKTRSKASISSSEAQSNFEFDKLKENEGNYFIFGTDKSGKSSLLKYIQIRHLKRYSTFGNIPFYMDFKELSSSIDDKWDIVGYMSKYFELSKNKTKELIEKHNFRLLIDNFDPNSYLYTIVQDFLNKYPKINYVICSDQLASRELANYSFGERTYQKLFLHDITRKEVRQYANSYLARTIEEKDQLIDKIVSFCKQLEMPLNYWTVSIILLIHQKSKFDLSKNLYKLLDLSVDEILQKKYLTLTLSRIDFDQIKEICGELACDLLLNHAAHSYSTDYSDVLNLIQREVKKNIRLTANPEEILTYLFESGVLKYKEDQKVTFRLNGIFEYFVAFKMSEDEEMTSKIINDDNVYLSFKNEIEIYSGIKNGEKTILENIFNKTKQYFQNINSAFSNIGNPDMILTQLNIDDDKSINLKEIVSAIQPMIPLDETTQDLIKDEADPISTNSAVTQKRIYDTSILTPEIFERYLSILARVFKTMDNIKDEKLLQEVLDFLLQTYTNFGFFLIREFQEEFTRKGENAHTSDEEKNILIVLNKFLPLLVQISFSDGIAHYNVENLILNKIDELKKDAKHNQYYIFSLYFILMDIDEKNITKYADDVISLMNIGILKYSMIMKLNYYFSFNGHRNKTVASFLKNRIQKAQMKLNEKTDEGRLQQGLEKQGKINLLKK